MKIPQTEQSIHHHGILRLDSAHVSRGFLMRADMMHLILAWPERTKFKLRFLPVAMERRKNF